MNDRETVDRLSENSPKASIAVFALDWFLVLCIFSLYAGSITPDVNESHYWVKAKHFWIPDFASRDLFVQSKDAHWFFFGTIGFLTDFLSLPVATWLGRISGWAALSFGWCVFVRRFSSLGLAGSLTCAAWIAAMHWGHLSGEWVVGGSEAKVFAYASAFIGLSCFLERSIGWGWVWMGFASAFHVLTGAWLVVASLIVLGVEVLLKRSRKNESETQNEIGLVAWRLGFMGSVSALSSLVGLIVGGLISLLGLLPAIKLNHGANLAEQERGAIIYVFQRLPHHLVPSRFAPDRWLAFAVLLVVTAIVLWLVRRTYSNFFSDAITKSSEVNIGTDRALAIRRLGQYDVLIRFAFVFSLIALMGVILDFSLSGWATNWSASVLRYYWFRWNDVIWPTVLVVSLLLVIEKTSSWRWEVRYFASVILIASGLWVVGSEYIKNYNDSISPADQAALLLRGESRAARVQIHQDWLDICTFIRTNTPEDALFLTPRFQQTFKWNAARAEVVCWKDSPQDALGLIEWESRMLAVFPSDENGYGMPWSDSLLSKLQKEYDFDYVLIDRRIQKTPPVMEFIHSNSTYALFRTIKLDSASSR
ncbi:MAG: hypothetical protein NTW52_08510 [Planctomycetota bacterium]|nr:hypothetical protein [Planctomycetota bacterium]